MSIKVIAIDPGLTGAIALLDEERVVRVFDMPVMAKRHGKGNQVDGYTLSEYFRIAHHDYDFDNPDRTIVVIERVNAMPGQGVTSVFSFGHSAAAPEFVAAALGFSVAFPTPQKWKKHFSLIGRDKDAARTTAIQLFPSMSDQLKRKKDIGRADAILIGKYAIDQLKQGKTL